MRLFGWVFGAVCNMLCAFFGFELFALTHCCWFCCLFLASFFDCYRFWLQFLPATCFKFDFLIVVEICFVCDAIILCHLLLFIFVSCVFCNCNYFWLCFLGLLQILIAMAQRVEHELRGLRQANKFWRSQNSSQSPPKAQGKNPNFYFLFCNFFWFCWCLLLHHFDFLMRGKILLLFMLAHSKIAICIGMPRKNKGIKLYCKNCK